MYPWEKVTEWVTDAGVEIWSRSVPPFVTGEVYARQPPPPLPKVEIKSVAGQTETKPALPETPEFEEYQAKRREYDRDLRQTLLNFELGYSVVKWRFPGQDKAESSPPSSWVPPDMSQWGIKHKDDAASRRTDFIKYCLILTDNDQTQQAHIMAGTEPVKSSDIKAALVPTKSPEAESS